MTQSDSVSPTRRRGRVRRLAVGAAALAVLGLIAFGLMQARAHVLEQRLLTLPPNETVNHKDLARFAVAEAKPLFARDCAVCHGADMKGSAATGAPNLTDQSWLYGEGDVFAIERTILYGVRSTQQKSHNVTEMPAYGLRGQLSDADIRNVVQYVLQLSHRPADAQAALAGREVYNGEAACGDCHGPDGAGNSDYGAPDLTADSWLYGGDPGSLYNSIYYGHHGVMPAWIGKLTPAQIRALAVYIYVVSHR